MPSARIHPSVTTVDDSTFSEAIDNYVSGRLSIENPTMQDYYMHYGSNSAIAQKLVEGGYYTNYNSAMRQVQRLMKNPDMKVIQRTQEALGSLSVPQTSVTITIAGYASYDGGNTEWRPMRFSHTFSPDELRTIIAETQVNGNQAGYDAFMNIYGVPVTFSFLLQDLSVQIGEN